MEAILKQITPDADKSAEYQPGGFERFRRDRIPTSSEEEDLMNFEDFNQERFAQKREATDEDEISGSGSGQAEKKFSVVKMPDAAVGAGSEEAQVHPVSAKAAQTDSSLADPEHVVAETAKATSDSSAKEGKDDMPHSETKEKDDEHKKEPGVSVKMAKEAGSLESEALTNSAPDVQSKAEQIANSAAVENAPSKPESAISVKEKADSSTPEPNYDINNVGKSDVVLFSAKPINKTVKVLNESAPANSSIQVAQEVSNEKAVSDKPGRRETIPESGSGSGAISESGESESGDSSIEKRDRIPEVQVKKNIIANSKQEGLTVNEMSFISSLGDLGAGEGESGSGSGASEPALESGSGSNDAAEGNSNKRNVIDIKDMPSTKKSDAESSPVPSTNSSLSSNSNKTESNTTVEAATKGAQAVSKPPEEETDAGLTETGTDASQSQKVEAGSLKSETANATQASNTTDVTDSTPTPSKQISQSQTNETSGEALGSEVGNTTSSVANSTASAKESEEVNTLVNNTTAKIMGALADTNTTLSGLGAADLNSDKQIANATIAKNETNLGKPTNDTNTKPSKKDSVTEAERLIDEEASLMNFANDEESSGSGSDEGKTLLPNRQKIHAVGDDLEEALPGGVGSDLSEDDLQKLQASATSEKPAAKEAEEGGDDLMGDLMGGGSSASEKKSNVPATKVTTKSTIPLNSAPSDASTVSTTATVVKTNAMSDSTSALVKPNTKPGAVTLAITTNESDGTLESDTAVKKSSIKSDTTQTKTGVLPEPMTETQTASVAAAKPSWTVVFDGQEEKLPGAYGDLGDDITEAESGTGSESGSGSGSPDASVAMQVESSIGKTFDAVVKDTKKSIVAKNEALPGDYGDETPLTAADQSGSGSGGFADESESGSGGEDLGSGSGFSEDEKQVHDLLNDVASNTKKSNVSVSEANDERSSENTKETGKATSQPSQKKSEASSTVETTSTDENSVTSSGASESGSGSGSSESEDSLLTSVKKLSSLEKQKSVPSSVEKALKGAQSLSSSVEGVVPSTRKFGNSTLQTDGADQGIAKSVEDSSNTAAIAEESGEGESGSGSEESGDSESGSESGAEESSGEISEPTAANEKETPSSPEAASMTTKEVASSTNEQGAKARDDTQLDSSSPASAISSDPTPAKDAEADEAPASDDVKETSKSKGM